MAERRKWTSYCPVQEEETESMAVSARALTAPYTTPFLGLITLTISLKTSILPVMPFLLHLLRLKTLKSETSNGCGTEQRTTKQRRMRTDSMSASEPPSSAVSLSYEESFSSQWPTSINWACISHSLCLIVSSAVLAMHSGIPVCFQLIGPPNLSILPCYLLKSLLWISYICPCFHRKRIIYFPCISICQWCCLLKIRAYLSNRSSSSSNHSHLNSRDIRGTLDTPVMVTMVQVISRWRSTTIQWCRRIEWCSCFSPSYLSLSRAHYHDITIFISLGMCLHLLFHLVLPHSSFLSHQVEWLAQSPSHPFGLTVS